MTQMFYVVAAVILSYLSGMAMGVALNMKTYPPPIPVTKQWPAETVNGCMNFVLVWVDHSLLAKPGGLRSDNSGHWELAMYCPANFADRKPGWYDDRLILVENVTHWLPKPPPVETREEAK